MVGNQGHGFTLFCGMLPVRLGHEFGNCQDKEAAKAGHYMDSYWHRDPSSIPPDS
jgi:hypothetical protein